MKAAPASSKAPLAATPRQAVVVLAMHRSGSSAISRALNLLGCALPKNLMGSSPSNPMGHWESKGVQVLNDEILASAGSDWRDWQAFPADWFDGPHQAAFLPQAVAALAQEFDQSPLFVFKDPRVCRIFPLWQQAFAAANITPFIVMPLRHPQEVADSLQKRDGLSAAHGLLLWLRHMLEAERASRGMARRLVHYDALLAAPVATMKKVKQSLKLDWPRLTKAVEQEIDSYIVSSLRHHQSPTQDMGQDQLFQDWLNSTYEILRRWSKTGEEDAADYANLDRIRAEFEALSEPLHNVVQLGQQNTDLRLKSKAKADTEAHSTAALRKEIEALKESCEALEKQKLQQQEQSRAELEKQKLQQSREIAQLRKVEQDLTTALADYRKLQDQFDHTSSTLRQRQLETEEAAAERVQNRQALQALTAERDDLAAQQAERFEELAILTQTLIAHEATIAQQNARLHSVNVDYATLGARADQLAQDLREQKQKNDSLAGSLKARDQQIQNLLVNIKDGEHISASLMTEISQRGAAIGHLMNLARDGKAISDRINHAIDALLAQADRPWLRGKQQMARKVSLLMESGLFDADWYQAAYQDVSEAGTDPAVHFILHGREEGRYPLPDLARFMNGLPQ